MIDFKKIEYFDDCGMSHYSSLYLFDNFFSLYHFQNFVFDATKLLIVPIASPSIQCYWHNLKNFFNDSMQIISQLLPFSSSGESNDTLFVKMLDWVANLFKLCFHALYFGLLLSLTLISLPTRLLSTFIFGMIASYNCVMNSSTDNLHSCTV